jgi:hypothetical protein
MQQYSQVWNMLSSKRPSSIGSSLMVGVADATSHFLFWRGCLWHIPDHGSLKISLIPQAFESSWGFRPFSAMHVSHWGFLYTWVSTPTPPPQSGQTCWYRQPIGSVWYLGRCWSSTGLFRVGCERTRVNVPGVSLFQVDGNCFWSSFLIGKEKKTLTAQWQHTI